MFALLASACVQNTTADDGSLSNAQAKSAGDSLGTSIESSASMFGPMDGNAAADGPPCVTVTGNPADTDGDNIPVNGTITYACTQTALGLTGMLTGTLALTDDDPNAAAWKFTGTANLHASLSAAGGSSIVIDRDGSIVASQTTTLGPFALTHDVDQVTVFTNAREGGGGPTVTTVTEAAAWALTFTPLASWTPGGLIVTGSLMAAGNWTVTVGTSVAAATLATPTPLTLTPTCETLVTAGVVTATYPIESGGEASVTTTWTGCGQHTVTNN